MKIGIIGAGNISKAHLRGYRENGTDPVAVCDPVETDTVKEIMKNGGRWYKTTQELFEKEKLDGISVCTPPFLHKETVIAAACRKIHVLCEKPLAATLNDGLKITKAASESGIIFMVAFCYRFHTPVVKAHDWLKEGRIGKVLMIRQRFGCYVNMTDRWFLDRKKGGGIINESMSHSVDIFHYLAGECQTALAITRSCQGGPDEDMAVISVASKTGTIGVLEGSWSTPISENKLEIYGEFGAIIVDHFSKHSATLILKDGTTDEQICPKIPDRFTREIAHFLACIKGEEKPLIKNDDGLKVLQTVELAYEGACRI
jgi:predicted dehydrogenase